MIDLADNLPRNWGNTRLGEIITSIKGKKPKRLGKDNEAYAIPYVNIKVFEKNIIEEFTDGDGCLLCRPQDVLIVWDGARFGLVGSGTHGAVGSTLAKLNCYELNSIYLFYFLKSQFEFINSHPKGVGIPHINPDIFWNIQMPIPPLPEQHRIVAKLEEICTRLDAGIEGLKKIQLQLKRYRQSVLKSAFSGELTAEWRKAHKDELESASALLDKIKQERKKSGKYKELPPLDTTDLPELPEEWVWTTIQYLAENSKHAIKAGPFGSSLKKEFYKPSGYKIYGQEQVIRGDSSYGDYYIDKERFEKLKSCSVKPDDILISLVGTIGKVLVLPETIEPGIINPRLVKLSLENSQISNIYIKAYIESSTARQYFSLSSHGGTMDILNLSILKKLPIPLPPTNEQKIIQEEIDRCFSIADEIEKTIEQSLKQADRLRQSILKRAFEGKLVLQNPDDEPAEKLLERIKAERTRTKMYSKQGGLL